MIFEHRCYREILKCEYEVRRSHNPSYSLRSFSRTIRLSPSRLSEILKKKQGLSAAKAGEIAKQLNFNKLEREYFVTLVEVEHGRSKAAKEVAKIRLKKFGHFGLSEKRMEIFEVISNWEHLAIVELMELSNSKSSYSWIAKQLGISREKAHSAVERLLSVGLLVREKRTLKRVDDSLFVWTTEIPSASIKNYHKGVLLQALRSLYTTPIEQREFSSIVLPVSEGVIADAKKRIKDFTLDLSKALSKKGKKTRVYYFASQFFPINHL